MKISTRSLAAMALAASAALAPAEACAPLKREPVMKVAPSRAQAWLAVLIREGYLNPDGSPRPQARPLPKPFEDDQLQAPPPQPTPRPPKECRGCGRG